MENTEQYIVPEIIFIQHLFFLNLRDPDEVAMLVSSSCADEMADFNKWNSWAWIQVNTQELNKSSYIKTERFDRFVIAR